MEEIPDQNNIEKLTEQVRERYIEELSDAIKTYGEGWVNKEHCQTIINKLKEKEPIGAWVSDPFYGDVIWGILSQMGISEKDSAHVAIRKNFEEGEKY